MCAARGGIQVAEFNPINPLKARGKWRRKEGEMKRIIILGMVFVMTLGSLGGCCFVPGYDRGEGRGRDGGHDRGEGRGGDEGRGRDGGHDRGGGHEERR